MRKHVKMLNAASSAKMHMIYLVRFLLTTLKYSGWNPVRFLRDYYEIRTNIPDRSLQGSYKIPARFLSDSTKIVEEHFPNTKPRIELTSKKSDWAIS